MTVLAVWFEARPAPHLGDFLVDRIPFIPSVSRWNYYLWLGAWMPLTFCILARFPRRGCRLLVAGGLLSVLRGLCIAATGLGPVRGADVNAGLSEAARWDGILAIANPIKALLSDDAFVYLTKDLFFSGHIATTFLLLLYVWPHRGLRLWALLAHFVVMLSVFFSHLHYTIDVIGAYAITFSFFVLFEKDPRQSTMDDMGPSWGELK